MASLYADLIPRKTPLANDCVLLAIYPREVSGYATMVSNEEKATVYSGSVDAGRIRGVIRDSRDMAHGNKRPLIVVAESMKTGDRRLDRRARALSKLGYESAWTRWREEMVELGVPKRRVHVAKITWRDLFFDGVEQTPEAAVEAVRKNYGENVVGAVDALAHHEEAIAICLATWARHDWDIYHKIRHTGARYP